MRKMQEAQGLDQLIEAGSTGYLPLFYQEWIMESFADKNEVKRMSFSKAAETVHKIYRQIERHHSIEKKKTAIQALNNAERKDFVLSFMKMVEYRALDKLKELH
jgi:hypothetical protein